MFVVAVALLAAADVDRLEIGPLRVEVSHPSKEIGLDDPLLLEVTIQHPPNVVVEPPALRAGTMLDGALVTQVRVDGPDAIDGPFGRIQLQNWVLTLEPTKTGPLAPGKLKTRYQEKGKPPVAAEIPLPAFDVKPGRIDVGPRAELKLPPPLESPKPIEPASEAAWWMKVVGGGVLAVCLIALALVNARSKSTAVDVRTAILAAGGTPRQAISLICDAVRRDLQEAHGISAAHLTTPELLGDDNLLEPLPADKRAAIAELLPLADMLRFPQPEPTGADLERCRAAALRAVGAEKRA